MNHHHWLGKFIGGLSGFLLAGVWGAILGVVLGHAFDKRIHLGLHASQGDASQVRRAFFEALFGCMGHLAKSDGRVTENEIQAARLIMQNMQLSPDQIQQAIHLFTQGKSEDYNAIQTLENLRALCVGRKNVLRMFLEFQFQAAYADGQLNDTELMTLKQYALTLGFSEWEFNQLHGLFQAQYFFHQYRFHGNYSSGGHRYQQSSFTQNTRQHELKRAYAVLGLPEGASKEEAKRAYRKLMNQYHPDKLVAKGLPEAMMKAATEKAQEIKAAYELIAEH
ncbi:MAG: co-chaperone DjlA [Gammaproteobacteria bacterium]|nr:co-chaperone DjlA [Gammaproteobacteria bacterium]